MDARKTTIPSVHNAPQRKPNPFGTRMVLIAGFSGLLAIMTVAGIYSLRIAREIQDSNTQMRHDFLRAIAPWTRFAPISTSPAPRSATSSWSAMTRRLPKRCSLNSAPSMPTCNLA